MIINTFNLCLSMIEKDSEVENCEIKLKPGNKIGEVLGSLSNTNSHLSKFPENGDLFLNQ